MKNFIAALSLLLAANAAEAQVLRAGDLLVETTLGWGSIDPATGTLGYIPWGPWPGDIGRIFDAEVTPSGQVWATSYFTDPNGGSCQCAGGIGLVDPDDGSIQFIEESPGVPLVVGRRVSSVFSALLAVDEASMRVFASFPSETSLLELSPEPVTRTPMMGSGPWKMQTLASGSIVAGGVIGSGLPRAITASAPPYASTDLNPTLAGFPFVELRSPWLALAGPQSALMSLLFYSASETSNGIFAVDTTTGAATLVLGADPSLVYGQIVAGGGLAYARSSHGITEIDLSSGANRVVHDGAGILRLVQVVPIAVPEPSAQGLLPVCTGALVLLAGRAPRARRGRSRSFIEGAVVTCPGGTS